MFDNFDFPIPRLRDVARSAARDLWRRGRMMMLWRMHGAIVRYCEKHFLFSPDNDAKNQGYADGLREAASMAGHWAWGHPEVTMRDAARIFAEEAKSWEPRSEE